MTDSTDHDFVDGTQVSRIPAPVPGAYSGEEIHRNIHRVRRLSTMHLRDIARSVNGGSDADDFDYKAD